MQLDLTDDQTMLVDSFRRFFEEESSMARVRAAEPLGHDDALWRMLGELGVLGMRVPGEESFSLFDTALFAQEAGRQLASGPIVEAIVAARLLASLAPDHALIGDASAGEAVITIALHDAEVEPGQLVPGGAVADAVLFVAGDTLRCVRQQPQRAAAPNHADQPLAALALGELAGDAEVIAEGAAARAAWDAAIEEWKLLTTATLVAQARRSIEIAAAYAVEREQFGRPIGSFQAVAHPLADRITDIEGAQMLLWSAIAKVADGAADAGAAISMAFWWAAHVSGEAVARALHTLGGYGLSTEYDIQLFHRRAKAAALILGDPADELIRAGQRLWLGAETTLPDAGPNFIELSLGAEAEAFAAETTACLDANLTPELRERCHYSFDGHIPELNRSLGAAGLIFPTWPIEWGGRDADSYTAAAGLTAWEEAGVTTHAQGVSNMVGHVIMRFGSDALKQEVLPPMARGEIIACLGYSEPSSGSDVFAARTKAERVGDDWLINGQKMFTSGANLASYVLLLTRTDPDAPKHKGITLFVVPMDNPGIEVFPIFTFQDERTNATFYSDVRIPDRYRLGQIHGGTEILGWALALEQGGGGFVSPHRHAVEAAVDWARDTVRGGRKAIEDPRVIERLARARTRVAVSELLHFRSMWLLENKRGDRAAGPMSKLFSSEAFLEDSADLFDLAAPASLMRGRDGLGVVELAHRHSAGTTIYAGTSEVQRSQIAEKQLGLPRSR